MSATRGNQRDEDGSGRAFRIFFRGFLVLCLIPCTIVIFDVKAPLMHRATAGILWPALAFMFFAVGRPPIGRLYAVGIGLFCLLLGGFGTIACLLDEACVPLDEGLVALGATAVFLGSRTLDLRLPSGSLSQLISRCMTIVGLTAAFYVAFYHRAFGGGIMFLVFGVLAFVAVLQPASDVPDPKARKPSPVEPHSPIVLIAGSAAYWSAAYVRGPAGALFILGAGTAWLLYTIYRFWRSRKTVKPTPG